MRLVGGLADALRVIGRLLDSQSVERAEIKYADRVEVTWTREAGGEETTSYSDFDIAKLREQAPLMRRPVALPKQGEREELLRTLGQELDAQGIAMVRITEEGSSFQVHGTQGSEPVYRFYSRAELRALSEQRRALRRTPNIEASPTR